MATSNYTGLPGITRNGNHRDPHAANESWLRQNLFLVGKNTPLVLCVTAVTLTICATYAFLLYKPSYAANASVIIKDSAVKAKYVTEDNYSTTSSQDTNPVLNTMELLKSDIVISTLWNSFILKHPAELSRLKLKNIQEWRQYFGDGKKVMSTKNTPGTDVINLSFKWTDPELAREGMEIMLKGFQDASREMNQAEQHERYVYLTQQAEDIRGQLYQVRTKIKDFKQKNNVTDIEEDLKNYSRTKLDAEQALNGINSDAANYKKVSATYRTILGLPVQDALKATALGKDQSLQKLYDDYYTMAQEYAALSSRYTNDHVKVREARSKLLQAKQSILNQINRSTGKSVPSKLSSTKADAVFSADLVPKSRIIADDTRADAVKDMLNARTMALGFDLKAATVKEHLDTINNRVKKLPEIEQTLDNMQQSERELSTSLDTLDQQMIDAKIREAQTSSNVFVIRHPDLPENALPPTRVELVFLGMIAGLVSGSCLALIKEKYLKRHDKPLAESYHTENGNHEKYNTVIKPITS